MSIFHNDILLNSKTVIARFHVLPICLIGHNMLESVNELEAHLQIEHNIGGGSSKN